MTHAAKALEKRPFESKRYNMDLVEHVEPGDTITGTPTVTATPTGLTVSGIAVASPKVQFRIAGGADKAQYKIVVKVATTEGDALQGEGWLDVKEAGS